MNWSARTKLLMTIGLVIANVMVVAGWSLMKTNGGNAGGFPISLGSFMGIMDFTFFFCVFLRPAAQARKESK